jgi:ribonuclease HI
MSTVFQAELCAIQMACIYAADQADTQVLLLSDSQAAILAAQHPTLLPEPHLAKQNSP